MQSLHRMGQHAGYFQTLINIIIVTVFILALSATADKQQQSEGHALNNNYHLPLKTNRKLMAFTDFFEFSDDINGGGESSDGDSTGEGSSSSSSTGIIDSSSSESSTGESSSSEQSSSGESSSSEPSSSGESSSSEPSSTGESSSSEPSSTGESSSSEPSSSGESSEPSSSGESSSSEPSSTGESSSSESSSSGESSEPSSSGESSEPSSSGESSEPSSTGESSSSEPSSTGESSSSEPSSSGESSEPSSTGESSSSEQSSSGESSSSEPSSTGESSSSSGESSEPSSTGESSPSTGESSPSTGESSSSSGESSEPSSTGESSSSTGESSEPSSTGESSPSSTGESSSAASSTGESSSSDISSSSDGSSQSSSIVSSTGESSSQTSSTADSSSSTSESSSSSGESSSSSSDSTGCDDGMIKCSDGVCRADCAVCDNGMVKCSNGVCKETEADCACSSDPLLTIFCPSDSACVQARDPELCPSLTPKSTCDNKLIFLNQACGFYELAFDMSNGVAPSSCSTMCALAVQEFATSDCVNSLPSEYHTPTFSKLETVCSSDACSASKQRNIYSVCDIELPNQIDYTSGIVSQLTFPSSTREFDLCPEGCNIVWLTFYDSCLKDSDDLAFSSVIEIVSSFNDMCAAPVPPPAVTSVTGIVLSESSVYISWSAVEFAYVSYIVEMSVAGTDQWEVVLTTASTFTQIDSLQPYTTYSFRVLSHTMAYDAADYSPSTDLTTYLAAPAAPASLTIVSPNSNTAELSWPAVDAGLTDPDLVVMYILTRFDLPYGFDTDDTAALAVIVALGGITFSVKNFLTYTDYTLSPASTYYYEVAAFIFDQEANLQLSLSSEVPSAEFVVTADLKPSIPLSFAVYFVDSTLIKLLWQQSSFCGGAPGACAQLEYIVEASTDNGVTYTSQPSVTGSQCSLVDTLVFSTAANGYQAFDSSINTCTLDFIATPGANYYFRLTAKNSVGNSVASYLYNILAPGLPPTIIKSLEFTVLSSTSIRLLWANDGSFWNDYTFPTFGIYFTVDGFDDPFIADTADLSFDLTGLSPSTTYQISYRVQNDYGISDLSEPLSVTTLKVNPKISEIMASCPSGATSFIVGCSIQITFDQDTNGPLTPDQADIGNLLSFSNPLPGSYSGEWDASGRTFTITWTNVPAGITAFDLPVVGSWYIISITGDLTTADGLSANAKDDDSCCDHVVMDGAWYTPPTPYHFFGVSSAIKIKMNSEFILLSFPINTDGLTLPTSGQTTVTIQSQAGGFFSLSNSAGASSIVFEADLVNLNEATQWGNIRYKPASNFFGIDTIFVTIRDADTVTIKVEIERINSPITIIGPTSKDLPVGGSTFLSGWTLADIDDSLFKDPTPVSLTLSFVDSATTLFTLTKELPKGLSSTAKANFQVSSLTLQGTITLINNYLPFISVQDLSLNSPSKPSSFSLFVSDNGNSGKNSVPTSFSLNPKFSIICSASTEAPRVLSVQLSDDLVTVTVTFDRFVVYDTKGLCSAFFSTATVNTFGSGAVCYGGDSSLSISLSYFASLTLATPIEFLSNSGIRYCGAGLQVSGTYSITAPVTPITPVVTFGVESKTVGICEDVVLTAFAPQGLGAQDGRFSWSCNVSKIVPLNYDPASNTLTIPTALLSKNTAYTFKVQVSNWLNTLSQFASITVFKSSKITPMLSLSGSSTITTTRPTSITIYTKVELPPCLTGNDKNVFFVWTSSIPISNDSGIVWTNPNLVIPPNVLQPKSSLGSNYIFTVTTTFAVDPTAIASASSTVTVADSPLSVIINGGENIKISSKRDYYLTATATDPDSSTAPFTYVWSCTDSNKGKKCYNTKKGDQLVFPNSPSILIQNGLFNPGSYDFSVSISKPSRGFATDTATLVVVKENIASPFVSASLTNTPPLSSSDTLVFSCSATDSNCDDQQNCPLAYKWENRKGNIVIRDYTLDNDTNPVLILKPLLDRQRPKPFPKEIEIIFRCTVTNTLLMTSSSADASATIASPPKGGIITVSLPVGVLIGYAQSTVFILRTSGWSTNLKGSGLFFQFFYYDSSGNSMQLGPASAKDTLSIILPAGDESRGNALILVVRCSDSLGLFATSSTSIVVSINVPVFLAQVQAMLVAAQILANFLKSYDIYLAYAAALTDTTNKVIRSSTSSHSHQGRLLVTADQQAQAQATALANNERSLNMLAANLGASTPSQVMASASTITGNVNALSINSLTSANLIIGQALPSLTKTVVPSCKSSTCQNQRVDAIGNAINVASSVFEGALSQGSLTPSQKQTFVQNADSNVQATFPILSALMSTPGESYTFESNNSPLTARRDASTSTVMATSKSGNVVTIPSKPSISTNIDTFVSEFPINIRSYSNFIETKSYILSITQTTDVGSPINIVSSNAPIQATLKLTSPCAPRCQCMRWSGSVWTTDGVKTVSSNADSITCSVSAASPAISTSSYVYRHAKHMRSLFDTSTNSSNNSTVTVVVSNDNSTISSSSSSTAAGPSSSPSSLSSSSQSSSTSIAATSSPTITPSSSSSITSTGLSSTSSLPSSSPTSSPISSTGPIKSSSSGSSSGMPTTDKPISSSSSGSSGFSSSSGSTGSISSTGSTGSTSTGVSSTGTTNPDPDPNQPFQPDYTPDAANSLQAPVFLIIISILAAFFLSSSLFR